MSTGKRFSRDVKLKCLLWSNRHCCLCDRPCGLDIEIAHIDPKGGNDFENAIPVCYTHHAEMGRYNSAHPRGNKYRTIELRRRREQIYEEHTRHLVPPLVFHLAPRKGESKLASLPTVVFIIENHGIHLSTRFKVKIRLFLGSDEVEWKVSPYYSGQITWNLNAGQTFVGNFEVPKECVSSPRKLRAETQITVINQYDRPHKLLPECFTYVRDKNHWFTEPTSWSELERFKV